MTNKPVDKQKVIRKPVPTQGQELAQPRSFLADLFKEPSDDDPIEAAAARAKRFGRTPDIIPNQSGSFTK